MSRGHDALDRRPGSPPEVRTDIRGLSFFMRLSGTRSDERLVIRCDDNGEVWMSIQPDEASDH
jgi:hypothetical protein